MNSLLNLSFLNQYFLFVTQASLEVQQAGVRTLNALARPGTGLSPTMESSLTILHYNDVYNVESSKHEPVGGAARFCTAIKSFAHLNPLVLFSGDIFSPSICKYHFFLLQAPYSIPNVEDTVESTLSIVFFLRGGFP